MIIENKKYPANHVYDFIIVGAGLSGLLIANKISQKNQNVLLLDGADTWGGVNRPVASPTGPQNNGLRWIPANAEAEEALSFLEETIGVSVSAQKNEIPPITYDSGNFKQFVGFGANPPEFYDELAYFLTSERIELSVQPYAWPQLLVESYKGSFLPKSYVTKFFMNDKHEITHVMVNGSKVINGAHFIYCGDMQGLSPLLPEGVLSTQAKKKISKNLYWTGVGVDLTHGSQISESSAIHVLNGTTQDEIGPCVGLFHPPIHITSNETPLKFNATESSAESEDVDLEEEQENSEEVAEQSTILTSSSQETQLLQTSQWLTFVDEQDSEEDEIIATALKKIKKQLKRAYPNAFESIKLERIVVTPSSAANIEIKLNSNQSVPGAKNLWIGSSHINSNRNLLGALNQAKSICTTLGFYSKTNNINPIEIKEEGSI
jgi:hypothetical protein